MTNSSESFSCMERCQFGHGKVFVSIVFFVGIFGQMLARAVGVTVDVFVFPGEQHPYRAVFIHYQYTEPAAFLGFAVQQAGVSKRPGRRRK